MIDFQRSLRRMRERNIGQWAIAYAAADPIREHPRFRRLTGHSWNATSASS